MSLLGQASPSPPPPLSGGNCFEPGNFSVGKRLINFGYKGVTFAGIGFVAGVFGTSLTNGLLLLR